MNDEISRVHGSINFFRVLKVKTFFSFLGILMKIRWFRGFTEHTFLGRIAHILYMLFCIHVVIEIVQECKNILQI